MTPAELRKHLRERRKATRALVAARQKATRAKVDANPAVRRARERRRRNRLATVMTILLLLLLISRCECDEPGPPPPPAPIAIVVAPPPLKPVVKPPPKKVLPKIVQRADLTKRPAFEQEKRDPPSWIDDFRLQVAARSPRLAKCFDGSERPGALRWTAFVNAGSGAVSDHVLEPMGSGAGLSSEQRECVVGVLSSPAYRLGGKEQALPERVSIAVEF